MITVDEVRTALNEPNPYTGIDHLIRAQMAAGRTTKQIFEDLRPLVDDLVGGTDVSEDVEEAFYGALDALTGNCHRDCQYRDPPNTTLPTEEEVEQIPVWAQVAFAARCARRVVTQITLVWPNAPSQFQPMLIDSLVASEQARESEELPRSAEEVSQLRAQNMDAFYVLSTTGSAADACRQALKYSSSRPRSQYPGTAYRRAVVNAACVSAYSAVRAMRAHADIASYIRRDFDLIARITTHRKLTDDTPVPPTVFGPLWPEGPPPGWPADPDVPPRVELIVTHDIREGQQHRDLFAEDEAVNVFNAINEYYIARTGERLTLDELHTFLAALVPAEV